MIDKKDILILKELDKNSRQSNTQIAKKIGLGKDTTSYRIKKLEEKDIISGYFSVIDYYKLNNYLIKFLIKFQNVSEDEEVGVFEWLKKRSEVIWAARTEGHWDTMVTIGIENLEESSKFLKDFRKKFTKNTKEMQLLIGSDFAFFNEKYIYEKKEEGYSIEVKLNKNKVEIDERDWKILNQLKLNARIPLIDIAEKIKLTPEATIKRIKKLEKENIILKYKLRINFDKLNLDYHHVYVAIKDYSKLKEVLSFYKNSNFCIFIMKYQGNYDFHLEWVTKRGELREKVAELRGKFGNFISDYKIISIFKEYKAK